MKQFIFSSESSQSRHINNGEKLKWVAKAGKKYKVIEQNGNEKTAVKALVIIKRGQHLVLRLPDGIEITIENFYQTCADGKCELDEKIQQYCATAAQPINIGDDQWLVYAKGDSIDLRSIVTDEPGLSDAVEEYIKNNPSQNELTCVVVPYKDRDEGGHTKALGAAVPVVATAVSKSGGSSGGNPPVDIPQNNTLKVSADIGKIISDNNLQVRVYKVSEQGVIDDNYTAGTLSPSGDVNFNLGDYVGQVKIAMVDNPTASAIFGYIPPIPSI